MKYRVTFAIRARRDLQNIYDYIVVYGGESFALNFVKEIYGYCFGFETFPQRGTKKNSRRQSLRHVGFKRKATIAFTIVGDEVIIIRVFRKGRNVDAPDNDTA